MYPVGSSIAILSRRALIRQGLHATLRDFRPGIELRSAAPADLIVIDATNARSKDHPTLRAMVADFTAPALLLFDPRKPVPDFTTWEHPPHSYLTLDATESQVLDAVGTALDHALSGHSATPTAAPEVQAASPAALSQRELDVLSLIATGMSNNDIAGELFLGINTVKTYIRTAYRKIGATSRTQAVLWTIEQGLTEPGQAANLWS